MSTQNGSVGGGSSSYAPRPAGPVEEKGRELGRKVDELGSRLQSSIRDKAHELGATGHQVHERLDAAKDKMAESAHAGRERASREVQEHPLRTLAWVFAAGAVFGMLLGRSSRR